MWGKSEATGKSIFKQQLFCDKCVFTCQTLFLTEARATLKYYRSDSFLLHVTIVFLKAPLSSLWPEVVL